jgi:hypothetical protein
LRVRGAAVSIEKEFQQHNDVLGLQAHL